MPEAAAEPGRRRHNKTPPRRERDGFVSDSRLKFDEAVLRICSYTNMDNRIHREYLPGMRLLPREMHTLEKIICHPGINTTKLAGVTGIPKGTISKMTRGFVKRGLIECYRDGLNRKEVYYKATKSGMDVFYAHNDFHNTVGREFYSYFESLPKSSREIVLDVLTRYADYMEDLCARRLESAVPSEI